MSHGIKKGIILAGGSGSRLFPLSAGESVIEATPNSSYKEYLQRVYDEAELCGIQ